jgi:hypothetical protein
MASSSSAGKWTKGILTTVVSSVAIYYLTVYLTDRGKTPPPAPLEIEGRVVDVSTNSLISGAQVRLKAEKFAGEQQTDSEGRYCFVVEALTPTTAATFEIEARGYPRYSINETLQYLSTLEDNKLMHTAANPPTVEPAGTPAAGGAGAAVGGAAIGAVVARNPRAVVAAHPAMPAPNALPSRAAIELPRYVRRADVIHLGPTASKP